MLVDVELAEPVEPDPAPDHVVLLPPVRFVPLDVVVESVEPPVTPVAEPEVEFVGKLLMNAGCVPESDTVVPEVSPSPATAVLTRELVLVVALPAAVVVTELASLVVVATTVALTGLFDPSLAPGPASSVCPEIVPWSWFIECS